MNTIDINEQATSLDQVIIGRIENITIICGDENMIIHEITGD
jgi:hypothetical protein